MGTSPPGRATARQASTELTCRSASSRPGRALAGVLWGALALIALVLSNWLARPGAARAQGLEHWVWTRISEVRPLGLAFSPGLAQNHRAYMASSNLDTPSLGFLYSTDEGQTWEVSNQGLPIEKDLMVTCLVASQGAGPDDLLHMAAEKRHHSADEPSGALYRSTDGGKSWSEVKMSGMPKLGERSFQVIEHLVLSSDFVTDRWMVGAVRGRGIFVSTDGGATWQQGVSGRTDALAMSPAFPRDKTLFAAVAGKGLLRSTDGGFTWALASEQLGSVVLSVALSPNFAQDGTLFVGTPVEGVLRSTDAGATWSPRNGDWGAQDIVAMALSPNYAADATVAIGSSVGKVFVSTDGGATWADAEAAALREPIIALRMPPDYAARPRLWAVGTFGGTWQYAPAADKASAEATATKVEALRRETLAAKPTLRATGTPQIELQRDRNETGCVAWIVFTPMPALGLILCLRRQGRTGL